jgi:type IV pilus assembly protein PilB
MQMGVPAFNIVSSVLLIMAQRLARRLCEKCKTNAKYPDQILLDAGFNQQEVGTFTAYTAGGESLFLRKLVLGIIHSF